MNKFYLTTVIDFNGEQVLTCLFETKEKAVDCAIADYEEEYTNIRSMGEKIENEQEKLKEELEEYGVCFVEELGSTYYVKEVSLNK